VLALVVAVAGTALADPTATISKLDKKEKKQVGKIAAKQVKKLAAGLTVANAARAEDADALGGQQPTAFAPSAEVNTAPRMVVNDPAPGNSTAMEAEVLTAGSFTVTGDCTDNFNGTGSDIADLTLNGPSNSTFVAVYSNGTTFNEVADTVVPVGFASGSVPVVSGGFVTAIAPNGEVLTVSGSAMVGSPAGDCIFGATAFGPGSGG
jgi:hypothetical protein